MTDISKTLALQARAEQIIPGGVQLLSKSPHRFASGLWPAYYQRAEGARIWDLDGNEYLDMSIAGIGANILGYCDPDVDRAVMEAVRHGSSTSLNCPEEVALAELLIQLHPWAEQVRYARTGGEAMAVAVRIARAATGRDVILFCGYHGWHDWYLAANLASTSNLDSHLIPGLTPTGVPQTLQGTCHPFHYNCIEELRQLLERHRGQVAAIVMEPLRDHEPENNFLQQVRALATSHGAVLVFDEITIAFRRNTGGIHLLYDVEPDIAVFAKAISNGYPMAAIIGRRDIMQHTTNSFISSTYWTERIGPVAAMATIQKHQREEVGPYLSRLGQKLRDGLLEAAQETGLAIHLSGIEALTHIHFSNDNDRKMITYFTQEMLKHGILASERCYLMAAHTAAHIDTFLNAAREVFAQLAKIEPGDLTRHLQCPPSRSGFKRIT